MFSRVAVIVLAICLTFGCVHPKASIPQVEHFAAPYQQFVSQSFDWTTVKRVVLMPLANQTAYTRVGQEMFSNLAAELQHAGRFDVVIASREESGARAQDVFQSGEFNEIEVLRIARSYGAQAVVFGNVTQYHPYSPPRVGLSLLFVSPAEGVAIASIDGLWDARETRTANMAREHFKRTKNWHKSLIDVERAIESPDVFQRFVCEQVAVSLMPQGSPQLPSSVNPPVDSPPGDVMPAGAAPPEIYEIPPVPPASMSIP